MRRSPLSISGIYRITCLPTGHFYIGSAANIRNRWRHHRTDLQNGTHHSIRLQRAWRVHGPDAFAWEVLEEAAPDALMEREQHYLDTLKPYNPRVGFNTARNARQSWLGLKHRPETIARLRGRIISPEARRRMSEAGKRREPPSEETRALNRAAQLRRPPPSEETRAKLSRALKGREGTFTGRQHSEETKRKMAEASKRRAPVSDETRRKMVDGAKRRPPVSEETRRRQSEARRGRGHGPRHIVTLPSGEEQLIHLKSFCDEHNLPYKSVKRYVTWQKPYKGYFFRKVT